MATKEIERERHQPMPRIKSYREGLKEMIGNRKSILAQVRQYLGRESEGGALVEFALILPMLLLIVTGIFTFGLALNNYLVLTEGVSTGARLIAVSRSNTLDPCATASGAIYAAAPTLNPATMTLTLVLNGTTYGPTTGSFSCSSASYTTGAAGNLQQGQPAQVIATYPCNLKVYGVNYAPSCILRAQTTEVVQ